MLHFSEELRPPGLIASDVAFSCCGDHGFHLCENIWRNSTIRAWRTFNDCKNGIPTSSDTGRSNTRHCRAHSRRAKWHGVVERIVSGPTSLRDPRTLQWSRRCSSHSIRVSLLHYQECVHFWCAVHGGLGTIHLNEGSLHCRKIVSDLCCR